jgi:TRAP-type C4-dicarboxylate transport system substrate-binding protein
VVYFSAPFWTRLKGEEQAALAGAAVEGARYFDALIVADEASSMATAAAAGGKIVQPEDRSAWEAGARGVWSILGPKVGGVDKIEAIAKMT